MKKESRAYIVMVLVNLIWGFGFVASELALRNNWPVYSILAIRNGLGFLICLLISIKKKFWKNKQLLKVGIIAGVLYFLGYALQLTGQQHTTVTNTSLITSLGIIMGPIFYWIIFKKKPAWYAFVACFMGLAGSFVLSYNPGMKFYIGDILVFISSLIYAVHLTYVGYKCDDFDLFSLLTVQFFVMAVFSFIGVGVTKSPIFGDIQGLPGVLYYALVSGILGIGGQFYCQRIIDSYKISLLLVLEGVFATFFSIVILKEELTLKVALGGGIMIVAILFLSIMDLRNQKRQEVENK